MKAAFSNTQIETLFDQSFNHGLTPFIEHPSLYKYGLPLLASLLEARIEWEQLRPIAADLHKPEDYRHLHLP